MQQIELSPARFSPQQLNEQQQELQEKISLLLDTVAVDEVTILFFLEESEREIDPETEFFLIIQKPRPSSKHAQLSTLERLAYCFYSLSLQQREDFQIMESSFQKYLRRSSYPSSFVEIHQQVRKWGSELRFYKTLNDHKKKLEKIRELMNESEKRLDLIRWRVQLCLLLFDIILIKQKTQRVTIAKILRQFKNLKRENKISTRSTLQAFSFLVNHLIASSNDAYILFERQIHIWSQEIVDNTLICQMKALVQKCQLHSINHLKSKTTLNIQANRITRGTAKPNIQTLIIANDINPRLYQPSSHRAERMLKKRPSRQKDENFMKQINHFLKNREGISFRSAENTKGSLSRAKVRISIKLQNHHSPSSTREHKQSFSAFVAPPTASYLKPNIIRDQFAMIQTLSASKSGGSFYRKKGTRKLRQTYDKIVEKEISKNLISSKHLRDEMFSLTEVQQQRCNISLQEILIGQFGKQAEQPLLKFVGAIEDSQFGVLNLSFLTIFNQELAQLNFNIRKNNKNLYIVQAKVRSTYCSHTTLFRVGKNNKAQFTIQQLNESIVGSSIYYQALQQRIQRKIGISELQAMQELFYHHLHSQLSQNQLNKLLLCVDLLESEFFWYFTKSNYLSGTRLQKRNTMDFYDLSAFAVSLGKFKADFDSCLHEIVVVENVKSLVQTCVYLSHGRKIVYKALRKVKGQFFLQYLEATGSVYRSFSRRDRIPYFANTNLYRNMISLSLFSKVLEQKEPLQDFICNERKFKKSFDLQSIFKEKDIFTFLMKNIVENFIQLKYLRQIEEKLMDLNKKEDYEIFDQRLIQCVPKYKQDIELSDNEISDQTIFKPSIHSSLRFIRQNIISYCEAFKIGLNLLIVKKQVHLLCLDGIFYCVEETLLANGIRIIKACKHSNRSTYILFFCHQPLSELELLPSPFHKRLALKQENNLFGNLVRKNQPQPVLCVNLIPVCKQLLRLPHGDYCYACASQSLSPLGWRLDLYFPRSQAHFATYFDEQIFLQWLSGQEQESVWSGLLKMMSISQSQRTISLQNRRLQLFRCLRSLSYSQDQAEGSLQLIELDGQLQYLICDFEECILSVGRVESIMFLNNKLISNNTEKQSLQSYQNILNFLYYKITHAKLPAEPISLDYFIIQYDSCLFLLFCNNFLCNCLQSNPTDSKKSLDCNR